MLDVISRSGRVRAERAIATLKLTNVFYAALEWDSDRRDVLSYRRLFPIKHGGGVRLAFAMRRRARISNSMVGLAFSSTVTFWVRSG
jgi:hypothetical protein